MQRDKSIGPALDELQFSRYALVTLRSTVLTLLVGTALLISACSTTPLSLSHTPATQIEATTAIPLAYMVKTPDQERYRLVISIPDQRMALLAGRAIVADMSSPQR